MSEPCQTPCAQRVRGMTKHGDRAARGIRRSRDWVGSGRCCDLKKEGSEAFTFKVEYNSKIVISSEKLRENYAEIDAVAIKQAFTAFQSGRSNFLDAVSYIVM